MNLREKYSPAYCNRFIVKASKLALQLDFYLLKAMKVKCILFKLRKPVVFLLYFSLTF